MHADIRVASLVSLFESEWKSSLSDGTYNTGMAQSNANSFTTYLEEKQRRERGRRATQLAEGTPLSILLVPAENAGQPMLLPDLQAARDMSFFIFARAIKRLLDSDYIVLFGAPGSESAQLTKLGAEVALLALPPQPAPTGR